MSQDVFPSRTWTPCPEKPRDGNGVRNYQARNFLRDDVSPGDKVFFYHSVHNPGIVGLMEVTGGPRPDPSQWDPESEHPDFSSPPDKPRWFLVDVTLRETFRHPVSLKALRACPELAGMELLKRGSRLSVQPVSPNEFTTIMRMVKEVDQ